MISQVKVFSGRSNPELAERICDYLGIEMGKVRIDNFPDGEIEVKIEEDVRGREVFVVQPTCPPVNDHVMELLILLDSFRRASASYITAVIPYFGYARQDRKDVGRVPITAKVIANLLVTAGAERVVTMDLHAAQIQGFFDIPVDHLYASPVIHEYFKSLELDPADLVMVSPDVGGIKMVRSHAKRMGGDLVIVDKRRVSGEESEQCNIIGGPLDGKTAIIFDDMITTAGSVTGAAEVLMEAGAKEVYACATHAVLCGPALERLRQSPLKQVVVTDTIPLGDDVRDQKINVVSVAPLLGETMKRIYRRESVSTLFEFE